MTWRLVYASEVGTSHAHTGTPCQDSCWAQVDQLADGQPLLSLFVADGAGSAAKGGEGAELAIEAAAALIAKKVKQGEFGLGDTLATDIVLAVRERIYAAAEIERLKARDFACTFLGVLSTSTGTLVLQVGDGGVVVDTGAGLEVAVVPMSGEYANMTHFVTDEDAVTVLATKSYPDRALKVAAFTDGVQRLALNMATNTPHEPFFSPFFNGMAKATAEQEDQLQGLLVKFLGSQPVNERTDDDKTLALALWRA
ncbi:PP2C family serine/threonine-protein phosphatase [uncultured Piscinibacter sp.]|uniref:PP2C family serine/threonine-protein phosphatase n=1 Tax=uncultured Piscinibacter sp. TaxID=1131835 RepID=UPI002638484D|nr:PP2C family serine/threonine-protein phosphatase [uncultured Piscinibacter sp.]